MTELNFYRDRPAVIGNESLPGRLIVIEGTDGVGRSTQVALLKEWLEARGYAVVNTGLRRSRLAGRGIERAKRGNTLDPLTLTLFYATDFWDRLERDIVPALRAGMVALVDRYVFSLMVRAKVRGVPMDYLEDLHGFALVPDLVIYLEAEIDQLTQRILGRTGFDYWESGEDFLTGPGIHQNFVDYQTQVLREFHELARRYDFKTVNARGSVSDTFKDVCALVEGVVKPMGDEPPSATKLPK
jgi:dTMP kinase